FPGRQESTAGKLVHELHHDSKSLGVNSLTPTSLQLLHIAAHVDAIESTIIPALERGIAVVLDRFWWSTWVYGKISGVHENSLKSMIRAERIAWGKVRPTVIFLVSRNVIQPTQTYSRLSDEYARLAEREQRRNRVCRISNNGSLNEACADVISRFKSLSHAS